MAAVVLVTGTIYHVRSLTCDFEDMGASCSLPASYIFFYTVDVSREWHYCDKHMNLLIPPKSSK